MKSVFTQILALTLLSAVFAVGCGQKESSEAQGDIQVRIPWYEEGTGYALKMVELKGISRLSQVSGQYVKFYFAPRVVGTKIRGVEPNAQFIKTEEGFVPTNEVSQQMAAIYGHLQRLAELDTAMGVGNVNTWPRSVGIGVRLPDGMVNNAFYDGKTDSMLIVPYSDRNLPIAVNAGILAHEHFHSLFYKIVIKPLLETPVAPLMQKSLKNNVDNFELALGGSRASTLGIEPKEFSETELREYYHLVLTRGLNEGLADFWAWVYTGDPDFISLSLPEAKKFRTLRVKSHSLPSREMIQGAVTTLSGGGRVEARLTGYSYAIGTQISRVFKNYTEIYARARNKTSVVARHEVAQMIVSALPLMKADFLELTKVTDYYTPEKFFLKVISLNKDVTADEKLFIERAAPSTVDPNSNPEIPVLPLNVVRWSHE